MSGIYCSTTFSCADGALTLRAMESEARAHSPRIWSPPVLQGFVSWMIGTGLLPYIRPVNGGVIPLASMKCARIVLIGRAVLADHGDYQVFDTPV
jgi:hypothetical protein